MQFRAARHRTSQTDYTRRRLLALAGMSLIEPATALAFAKTRHIDGHAFGSHWQLTLPVDIDAAAAVRIIRRIVDDTNQLFSPYRTDSMLCGFNRHATTRWQPVPIPFAELVRQALSISQASDGLFDPTVGPWVHRFGFGPVESIESRSQPATGWEGISVRHAQVRKQHPGLSLDLCGIAKGASLDRMTNALERAGHTDFFLEVGGEVMTRGQHPTGRAWRVGIEHPVDVARALFAVVEPGTRALATSGIRHQQYSVGGRRYTHLIDPFGQQPIQHALASVSVLAATAREADAWATALMVAGPQDAPRLAEQHNISALFIESTGETVRASTTSGFQFQPLELAEPAR